MRIAKHVAGYARDVRWRLNDLRVHNEGVTGSLINFLRWKLGGHKAVCVTYIAHGYSHFEKTYADEAAAIYLLFLRNKMSEQPHVVIPQWMIGLAATSPAARTAMALVSEWEAAGRLAGHFDVPDRVVDAVIQARQEFVRQEFLETRSQPASAAKPQEPRISARSPATSGRTAPAQISTQSAQPTTTARTATGVTTGQKVSPATAAGQAQVQRKASMTRKERVDPCSVTGTWLPSRSRTQSNPDGSVTVFLPRGYRALPYDDVPTRRYRAARGGNRFEISCTCTDGTGDCSPVKAPGSPPGCVMGSGCKVCERSESALVVMGRGDIRYARPAGSGSLPAGDPEKLLRVREIRQRLNAFLQKSNRVTVPGRLSGKVPEATIRGESFIAPKGYVFTPLNVYGYAVYTLVSAQSAAARGFSGALGYSCKCTAGSGCKKKRRGPIYGCNAGSCSACKMKSVAVVERSGTTARTASDRATGQQVNPVTAPAQAQIRRRGTASSTPQNSFQSLERHLAALKAELGGIQGEMKTHGSTPENTLRVRALRKLGGSLSRTVRQLQAAYQRANHAQGIRLSRQMGANVNKLNQAIASFARARNAGAAQVAVNNIGSVVKLLEQNMSEGDPQHSSFAPPPASR